MLTNNIITQSLRKIFGLELPNNLYCTQNQDGKFEIIALVNQMGTNCQFDTLTYLICGSDHLVRTLNYYHNHENGTYISHDGKYGNNVKPLGEVLNARCINDQPIAYTRKRIKQLNQQINY